MLHATIRTPQGALHFIGELDGYNLETIEQYVTESTREWGPVEVRIELERDDADAFEQYAPHWLPRLGETTVVEIPSRDERRPQL
jgi:hypothetical protein